MIAALMRKKHHVVRHDWLAANVTPCGLGGEGGAKEGKFIPFVLSRYFALRSAETLTSFISEPTACHELWFKLPNRRSGLGGEGGFHCFHQGRPRRQREVPSLRIPHGAIVGAIFILQG